jgi:hypothetical protein
LIFQKIRRAVRVLDGILERSIFSDALRECNPVSTATERVSAAGR